MSILQQLSQAHPTHGPAQPAVWPPLSHTIMAPSPITQQQLKHWYPINTVCIVTKRRGFSADLAQIRVNNFMNFDTLAKHSTASREKYKAMIFRSNKEICE